MLSNRHVIALAYDGLCAFEFGVATELFGLARPEIDADWYTFEVITADPGPLRTVGGVTLTASTDLQRLRDAGTIVLPGWRDPNEAPPDDLLGELREAHSRGCRLMSICSGVFVLAATGLLDGLPATTHWRYTDQLQREHPAIDVRPDVLYIDNGTLLTSAGSAAGLDLGLHLIRRDFGADISNQVARRLVIAPHRDGGQAQFITHPIRCDRDDSLHATIKWAIESLNEPLSVNDLAAHAAMAPRTFARRFRAELGVPPHKWLTDQRVLLAQRLLETTTDSIDNIAGQCGFGSAATLRHHFTRVTRTTPARYRSTFTRTTGDLARA
jgi:AraC family transcriptional activator FtrA